MPEATVVIGIGNILLGDEGIGIHAVRELKARYNHPDIDFIDGGTSGHELLDVIAGKRKLIVIDAADLDDSPGTIARLTPESLLHRDRTEFSLHEYGLAETLYEAKLLNVIPPKVVIIAVQPESTVPSMELSASAREALNRLIPIVLAECGI